MRNLYNIIPLFLFVFTVTINAQKTTYFPEPNEEWKQKKPSTYKINKDKLAEAVAFAQSNEYSGSKDLRIAILKGFEKEPFHEVLGPTKKRGGPAGMILKNGYVISKWGNTNRVDMTFSVTKSFLSIEEMSSLLFNKNSL